MAPRIPRAQQLTALLSLLPALLFYLEQTADLRLPCPTHEPIAAVTEAATGMAPPASPDGVFAPNDLLHKAAVLHKGSVHGSESVVVGFAGGLWMLDKFGVVWRSAPHGAAPLQRRAQLGAGRPLGFALDAANDLIVCNAGTGLQKVELESGQVVLLASEAPSDGPHELRRRIHYANDLAIAKSGAIFFTDSTDIPPPFDQQKGFYDTLAAYITSMQRGKAAGRVLRFDPGSKQTSVLCEGIRYANGIALSPDESFLLMVETSAARVLRLWLTGPKAGQRDVWFESPGLPMYPDGITRGSEGTFWLALVAPRLPQLEALARYRLVRWAMARGPAFLRTPFKRAGGAVQLSAEGKVLRYLADPDGSHVASLSAVTETPKGLFFGNLAGDSVAFLAKEHLPPLLPSAA